MRFPSERLAKIIPVDRADRGRSREIPFYGAFVCIIIIVDYFIFRSGDVSTAVAMLYLALLMFHFVATAFRMRPAIARGRKHWHHDGRRVIMTCPYEMILLDIGFRVLGTLAGPLAVLTWIMRPRGDWIGPAVLSLFNFYFPPLLMSVIRGKPTRRRIILSKHGVEFIQINGHTDTIRWNSHPRLVGARQGEVIIAFKKKRELHYPISYLPLTYRQLDRLLRTLSTDGQLRADLAKPKALATVLTILEPTPDELTDGSWTWKPEPPRTATGRPA